MKSCLHKRCQFSFAEATFIPTTADPYDMDSDIDQQNSHQAMDSMEEDQSSFQGPEDMESRLSPSKDTVSEDDDTKDTSLALNHSPVSSQTIRNKRKNFKPRNIIYEQEQQLIQQQLIQQNQMEPKKIESPMDLSNALDLSINNGHQSENSDDEEESREANQPHPRLQMPPGPIPGLSVVRPEVLFGQANKMPPGAGGPIPPFLAPFLAASRAEGANGPSIKDAFQEVLKIFGFPPELAEVFAKNAQALQQSQGSNSPQPPEDNPIAAPNIQGNTYQKKMCLIS